jgi:hypothetical protein
MHSKSYRGARSSRLALFVSELFVVLTMGLSASCASPVLYEWLPSKSVPQGYTVEVFRGGFYDKDKMIAPLSVGGITYGPWGISNSIAFVGSDRKPIPSRIALRWLAYAEKKSYQLDVELPQVAIAALFKQGKSAVDPFSKHPAPYDTIMVGIAPGGVVIVWVGRFSQDRQIEVARYQGTETTITPEQYHHASQNADNLTQQQFYDQLYGYLEKDVIADIEKNGIPYGRWDQYRRKHQWNIKVIHAGNQKTVSLPLHMINGEKETLDAGKSPVDTATLRAMPAVIHNLIWQDGEKAWQAKLWLNEQEVQAAYSEIFEQRKATTATLVIKLDQVNETGSISLESGAHRIELKATKATLYTL